MRRIKDSAAFFRAADLLDKVGWCRFSFSDEMGRTCLVGALSMAYNGTKKFFLGAPESKTLVLFAQEVGGRKGSPATRLTCWNDQVARDKRQVQRKLRKFARIALKLGV